MSKKKRLPIGIFDSGLGGLTVVREINRLLPHENLIYVGDTARVPYGTKSPQTIRKYAQQITQFLLKKRVKAIVVACNSASSVALPALRRFSVPIIGVIEPGARAALQSTQKNRIAVIGTQATIRSEAYIKSLRRGSSKAKIWTKACPLFVPLVEEGRVQGSIAQAIGKEYLTPLKNKGVDTLVLGCTHYPLLKGMIRAVLGSGIRLIDSAFETAKELKSVLNHHDLLNPHQRKGNTVFYTTDNASFFTRLGVQFLGRSIQPARTLPLDNLI